MSTAAPAVAPLAARSLTRRFGARTALSGVSFEVRASEVVGIIGPNGAGKTTLLSILAGALAPSEGEVVSQGDRPLGWVPQQTALYSKLSVAENLRLFARLEKLPDPEAAVERMLAQTGLEDRADDELSRLSEGNRQRVNIAIGLLCEPAVLLLDEPSASLDPRQRVRLWQFIDGLVRGGTAVVFSTHDVDEAEHYAGTVLVLVDGELLFTGTPTQFVQAVGGDPRDLETAFVRFLTDHGH